MKVKATFKPILIGIFLLLAVSGVALAQDNSLIGELSEVDVFHPPANINMMPLYNEWHYFNIMDEEQDISIVCAFKLNGGIGAAEVLLGYYVDGSNPDAFFGAYPINDAVFSNETPNVEINNSSVILTRQGYSVHIVSDDGKTVFDALFKPEVEIAPVFYTAGFPTPYTEINWLVASTKMKVNGELSVGGETYTIKNARGYHDHNWGYWLWGDDLGWDWGQVTQTKSLLNGNDVGEYSLSFGNITDANHTKSNVSVLNVWKNKKIIAEFNGEEIEIMHSDFVDLPIGIPPAEMPPTYILPAGSFPLPLKTNITATSASDDDYLNIKFNTPPGHSVSLPVAVPVIDEQGNVLLQYRVIWEMIGTYEVNGVIDEKPISYTADGFMEYVSGTPVTPVPFSSN